MAYEQKELTGALFKNDKRSNENAPNAKGTAKIDGVEYYVAAWTKKDKNGNPWQSLSFTRKDERGVERAEAPQSDPRNVEIDDDLPF